MAQGLGGTIAQQSVGGGWEGWPGLGGWGWRP